MVKKKFDFYVAGVRHHQLPSIISELFEGINLRLVPEPTNSYDKNAIKIMYDRDENDEYVMLGYVPSRISADVKHFLSHSKDPVCEVIRLSPDSEPWNQLMVRIYDGDY